VLVTGMVAKFGLKPLAIGDQSVRWAMSQLGISVAVKDVYGLTGRPVAFKLRNGGQFEYFFLIVAKDGQMYLLAEYAYG
jgi:chemotaxis receptor (MCP) glutamine deamidase CheD